MMIRVQNIQSKPIEWCHWSILSLHYNMFSGRYAVRNAKVAGDALKKTMDGLPQGLVCLYNHVHIMSITLKYILKY